MGYSPWDPKESDMTERLTLSFTFSNMRSRLPHQSVVIEFSFPVGVCYDIMVSSTFLKILFNFDFAGSSLQLLGCSCCGAWA